MRRFGLGCLSISLALTLSGCENHGYNQKTDKIILYITSDVDSIICQDNQIAELLIDRRNKPVIHCSQRTKDFNINDVSSTDKIYISKNRPMDYCIPGQNSNEVESPIYGKKARQCSYHKQGKGIW